MLRYLATRRGLRRPPASDTTCHGVFVRKLVVPGAMSTRFFWRLSIAFRSRAGAAFTGVGLDPARGLCQRERHCYGRVE